MWNCDVRLLYSIIIFFHRIQFFLCHLCLFVIVSFASLDDCYAYSIQFISEPFHLALTFLIKINVTIVFCIPLDMIEMKEKYSLVKNFNFIVMKLPGYTEILHPYITTLIIIITYIGNANVSIITHNRKTMTR